MSTKSRSSQKDKSSLDRQITAQDLDCLKEAFALFDSDRKEEITTEELGKVLHISNHFIFSNSVKASVRTYLRVVLEILFKKCLDTNNNAFSCVFFGIFEPNWANFV